MERQEAIQVLDYYHSTWNLAGILDQHNYSQQRLFVKGSSTTSLVSGHFAWTEKHKLQRTIL